MSKFPTDWSESNLRRAADSSPNCFIDGDWIEAPFITDHGIRLIQTGNIARGSFLDKEDTQKYISRASFRLLNCKWVNPGDLLICRLADPIGRACVVPDSVGNAITSVDCTIFRVDASRFDKSFVLHWLNSDQNLKNASDKAAGSTRSRISRSNLGMLPIPEPDLNEQSLIGKILDALDTAIHETEAIIAKLKPIKQGLLHDLLTRGIDANGELRPPQAEAPHLYKQSQLGWIPKEWSCDRLANLIDVHLGFAFSSHDYVDDGVLSFRVTNIGQPFNDLGGVVKLPKDFLGKFPKQRLEGGEIMIVMVGATTGKMGRVPHAVCPALQNQNMWNLVPKANLDRDFAWMALPTLVERHLKQAQGSARDFLTQSAFLVEYLAVPPLSEQTVLIHGLSAIDSRLENENSFAEKLRIQKMGLMDDLLTGRVRVTQLLTESQDHLGGA